MFVGQTGIIDIRARKANGQSETLNAGAIWSVSDPGTLSLVPTANNRAANVVALKEGIVLVRVVGTAAIGQGNSIVAVDIDLTMFVSQAPPTHPVHTPGAELIFTLD